MIKGTRITRIVLLVIAVLVLLGGGLPRAKEAAHDSSDITVKITSKETSSDSTYHIKLTFSIYNGTGVEWSKLGIETVVYDKTGNELGTISADISFSNPLKQGETVTKVLDYESSYPGELYTELFQKDLSEFRLESRVKSGTYYD